MGAVAIDSAGHLACATSTGGITGKWAGRVGDTPVVGAGGFADDFVGAVSTTGHGENIMRVCLSRHVTGLMQQGTRIDIDIFMFHTYLWSSFHMQPLLLLTIAP